MALATRRVCGRFDQFVRGVPVKSFQRWATFIFLWAGGGGTNIVVSSPHFSWLSSSLAAYYLRIMTPKPSIHWAQDPHTPQMLYPYGGMSVCLQKYQRKSIFSGTVG
jgi:hypothetical protein